MHYGVIPNERITEAIALLYARLPGGMALAEQALGQITKQPDLTEGLLGIWDEQQVSAVIWISIDPSGSATLTSPALHPNGSNTRERETWGAQLISLANHWQQNRGTTWSQALLTHEDSEQWQRVLSDSGYEQPTKLVYLHLALDSISEEKKNEGRIEMPSGWSWGRATQLSRHQLLGLVEETFVDTRDCPFLGAHRTTDEIVLGFENTGDSKQSHWQILFHDGAPVGCVLGAHHRASALMEWAYVGLIPAMRRQGRGQWLCQKGLQEADLLNCRTVAMAVDQQNEPALKLYAQFGFEDWDRREVFIKWDWNQTSSSAST
ncbi:MAG: GNAT family N-acetyltransferase [Pirellulaceae bacterium]